MGKGGLARLSIDDAEVARGRIERTVPFLFPTSAETLDVGIDSGAPVGPYVHHFPYAGVIERVETVLRPELDDEKRAQSEDGRWRAALSAQ